MQLNSGGEKTLRKRFMSKFEKTDTCWLWSGLINPNGYGGIYYDSKRPNVNAHRVSWEIFRGKIPGDLLVLHKCDVRSCVNPEHLFLGTQKDNMQDCSKKKRMYNTKKTHCPSGHEYTIKNTYVYKKRVRQCRKCAVARSTERRKAYLFNLE